MSPFQPDWLNLSICLVLSVFHTGHASAQTYVGGTVYSDATWTVAQSPYELTSPIVVGNGATLTIEPGVEVRLGAGQSITIGATAGLSGTLLAMGTEQDPIVLTSKNAMKAPGDWNFLLFAPSATDTVFDASGDYESGSIVRHAVLEYGGSGASTTGVVTMRDASVLLDHVVIQDSPRPGLYAVLGNNPLSLNVWNSTIRRCVATEFFRGMGMHIEGGMSHQVLHTTIEDCQNTDSGAGIWMINSADAFFDGLLIRGCQAGTQGGAGHFVGCQYLTFRDSDIIDNRAPGIAGLYFSGSDDALVEGVDFRGNEAISNNGSEAAMHFDSRRGIIRNCEFVSNRATPLGQATAGALVLVDSDILVEDCLFEDNLATDAYGAVECVAAGTTFRRCVFRENHVVGEMGEGGGALYIRQASTTIEDCEFISNSAPGDGGAVLTETLSTDLRVVRCVFRENVSGGRGGGIHLKGRNPTIEDCTFDSNDAAFGGAVFVGSNVLTPTLKGNLQAGLVNEFLGNTAEEGSAVYNDIPYNVNGSGDFSLSDNCWGFATPAEIDDMVYDFLDDSSKGFAAVTRAAPCTCPADVNVDGILSPADFVAWIAEFYDNSALADQNGDGVITVSDFTAWIANFNAGC